MKILFITHYSSMYGANKSMLQLILELRKKFDVDPIVLMPEKGELEEALKNEKIEVIVFKYYPWIFKKNLLVKIKGILKALYNYLNFYKLSNLLSNKGIKLVHTNSSIVNIGGYISKNLKVPHIWHIREFGKEDYNLEYLFGNKRAGKFYEKNSEIVIAISKAIKDKYSSYIDKSKIKIVYNGIDKNEANVKDKSFINEKKIQLCFTGLLTKNKNQIEALKAIKILKDKNLNFILNIIGSGELNYQEQLYNFVKKNNLENNVKFWGYRKDVKKLLKKMDIGIVCSKNEAFGRVTVEYMLNKMPVIASNTGANSEIIINNETGYIYTIGNSNDLADKIEKLINDKKLIEYFSEKGFKRAINFFTSHKNTEEIYSLYKKYI